MGALKLISVLVLEKAYLAVTLTHSSLKYVCLLTKTLEPNLILLFTMKERGNLLNKQRQLT